jgi:tRNA(fMet)-specific endonuclease VapC
MLQFLLDTDHVTLFDLGHPPLGARLKSQPADAVGVSAVSVEEYLRGRLAAVAAARDGPTRILHYGHLLTSVRLFQQFPLVPYDQGGENHFQHLRPLRLKVGTQDLKIAALALANNLVLLTRNRRDFGRIPGLRIDDWSV